MFPRLISVKIGITKLKLIILNIARIIQYKNPKMWIANTPKSAAKILYSIPLEIFNM